MFEKQKTISVIFLTIAGVLLVSAVYKISFNGGINYADLQAQQELKESDIKKELKKQVDALKKVNMFAPYKKPQPPSRVDGIFGQKAYFSGRGYKLGDKVPPGAEITEIACAYVKLKFEGRDIKLYPINAYVAPKPTPVAKKRKATTKPAAVQNQVKAEVPPMIAAASGPADDDLAWLDIPEHLKDMVRQYWNQMSPEQKKAARARWENASQEERDKFIEGLQKQYDRMNG